MLKTNTVGQKVRDLSVTINGELLMDQQHVRNVVRAPSTLLPAPASCVYGGPYDNRRSTYSDCSQFVASLWIATRVDYCNSVRYGVFRAYLRCLECLFPVYLRSTSVSRGQFRAWLKIRLFNQAYDIIWEHFYFKSTYLLTYCGAGHEKNAVSGGYWKRCERKFPPLPLRLHRLHFYMTIDGIDHVLVREFSPGFTREVLSEIHFFVCYYLNVIWVVNRCSVRFWRSNDVHYTSPFLFRETTKNTWGSLWRVLFFLFQ